MDAQESEEVEIGSFRRRRQARECALVLHATGIPSRMQQVRGGQWSVTVASPDSLRAAEQYGLYLRENRGWPPKRVELELLSDGTIGASLYCCLLVSFHTFKSFGTFGFRWHDAGVARAGLIQQGEWWRALTALTLHTDLVHLAANLFFGSLFLVTACQIQGTSRALFSLLLAGGAGNYLNAWIQDAGHGSVGASTGVFGLFGLVAASVWQARREERLGRQYVPLMIGFFFLAYLGFSGERTDILAHVTGFACGLLLGFVHGRWGRDSRSLRWERYLAAVTPATLALAWWLAVRNG